MSQFASVIGTSTGRVVLCCCKTVMRAPFFVGSWKSTHVEVVASNPLSVTGLVDHALTIRTCPCVFFFLDARLSNHRVRALSKFLLAAGDSFSCVELNGNLDGVGAFALRTFFCQHVGLQHAICANLPLSLPVITDGGPPIIAGSMFFCGFSLEVRRQFRFRQ